MVNTRPVDPAKQKQFANDQALAYLILYSQEFEKDPTLNVTKFRALLQTKHGENVNKARAAFEARRSQKAGA